MLNSGKFLRMVILCWIWMDTRNRWCYNFDHRRRQHQCRQQQFTDLGKEKKPGDFSNMASSWCSEISPIISLFVCFLLVLSLICPVHSSETGNKHATNQTFRPEEELQKLKMIREHLKKINKPAVKTIQASTILFSFHWI